jgi:hypothetical protein
MSLGRLTAHGRWKRGLYVHDGLLAADRECTYHHYTSVDSHLQSFCHSAFCGSLAVSSDRMAQAMAGAEPLWLLQGAESARGSSIVAEVAISVKFPAAIPPFRKLKSRRFCCTITCARLSDRTSGRKPESPPRAGTERGISRIGQQLTDFADLG